MQFFKPFMRPDVLCAKKLSRRGFREPGDEPPRATGALVHHRRDGLAQPAVKSGRVESLFLSQSLRHSVLEQSKYRASSAAGLRSAVASSAITA